MSKRVEVRSHTRQRQNVDAIERTCADLRYDLVADKITYDALRVVRASAFMEPLIDSEIQRDIDRGLA